MTLVARVVGAAAVRLAPLRALLRLATMRGVVPRRVWRHFPSPPRFGVVVNDRASFRFEPGIENPQARAVYWRGVQGHEPETTRLFAAFSSRSEVVVDVGAHAGLYTLIACASNPSLRVHAFEPVPRIADQWERNAHLNSFSSRCVMHRMAASNHSGVQTLLVPRRPMPSSSRLIGTPERGTPVDAIDVAVDKLDTVLRAERRVDVVKIDVEGAEHLVLAGMTRVLREQGPVVFFECLPDSQLQDLAEILTSSGYRWFHLTAKGPEAMARLRPDPERRFRNFIAMPVGDARLKIVTSFAQAIAGKWG